MKTLIALGLWCALAVPAHAQCNPVCSSQPKACCGIQSDTFLAEECTGVTSDVIHFVLPGTGTGWVDHRTPANFSAAGITGMVTLGDVITATFQFTIGTSFASARFQVLEGSTLSLIGQCVGVRGVTYVGLPTTVSYTHPGQPDRVLTLLKTNTLYCRYTPTGGMQTDLLCLNVRGDVGGPFESGQLCDADRVEYACGTVQ